MTNKIYRFIIAIIIVNVISDHPNIYVTLTFIWILCQSTTTCYSIRFQYLIHTHTYIHIYIYIYIENVMTMKKKNRCYFLYTIYDYLYMEYSL